MISQRKIQANKRNAQKSTGPRTEEGVNKVKLNALTHGLTAQTIVLPHEDPEAYQHRLETWNRDLNPSGELGRYLVERGADLVAARPGRFPRAGPADRRVLKVPKDRQGAKKRAVDNLIRRLLDPVEQSREHYTDNASYNRAHSSRNQRRDTRDDPDALIQKLESTAEGSLRLLDEWEKLLAGLDCWIGPDHEPCRALLCASACWGSSA